MQEIRLKRMTHDDLIFNGELIAKADDRAQTDTHSSWLELTLYRTSVGKFILATSLHMFNFPEKKDVHGAVAFASASAVCDFLRAEGLGLYELIGQLLERAAKVDATFSSIWLTSPQPWNEERDRLTQPSSLTRNAAQSRMRRRQFQKIHTRRQIHA